eukprot:8926819-Alexandrium_andersonii.AAC.1
MSWCECECTRVALERGGGGRVWGHTAPRVPTQKKANRDDGIRVSFGLGQFQDRLHGTPFWESSCVPPRQPPAFHE